jgi:signal transduction histidine kinase
MQFPTIGNPITSSRYLSSRLGWNIILVGIAGFLGVFICVWTLTTARFKELERENLNQYVSRTEAVLSDLKGVMLAKSRDWGMWTDSYDYLAMKNPAFEAENFNYHSMENYRINALSYQRFDGKLRRSFYFDFDREGEDPALSRQVDAFVQSRGFLSEIRRQPNYQTFVRFGDRLVVLSATQVTRSDGTGTPEGFMMFGQEVDVDTLSRTLQTPVTYDFALTTGPLEFAFYDQRIAVAVAVPGVGKQKAATLRFHLERKIMLAGRDLIITMLAGIAAMIIAMAIVLNRRLTQIVIAPLHMLQQHVSEIGTTGQLKELPASERRDEIGQLMTGFNEMTRQLSVMRAQLDAQSFAIGKSQSTIGVMHNVKNGLSPLTVILSKLRSELDFSHQIQVQQALRELIREDVPLPRRQQLLAFVQLAITRLEKTIEVGRERLREARDSLASVMDTVDAMQTVEDRVLVAETIDASRLLNTSLSIARHSGAHDIEVNLQVAADNNVLANPVLLSQVFDNLLTNAVEAIAAANPECPKVWVEITVVNDRHTQIDIRDNGDGISADKLNRIFERAFSTRAHKQGGLGLHWCANTVNAMGGNLALLSDGSGRGTTARLTLPRPLPETAQKYANVA